MRFIALAGTLFGGPWRPRATREPYESSVLIITYPSSPAEDSIFVAAGMEIVGLGEF